jgi:biopolymer transport protein ExbD
MAALQEHAGNRKYGRKRRFTQGIRMDMTPMVDLAFLLLTFFILSATFAKPKSMELSYPAGDARSPVKNGITFLLSKDNRIFYYEGELKTGAEAKGKQTELAELSFNGEGASGLRHYLTDKNKSLHGKLKSLAEQRLNGSLNESDFKRLVMEQKSDKSAYTYLVKTDDKATYKNVIDVLDELNISQAGKYVVADLMKEEQDLLNEKLLGK